MKMKYLVAAIALLLLLMLGWLMFGPAAPGRAGLAGFAPVFSGDEGLSPGAEPVRLPATGSMADMPPELADIPLDEDAIASLRGAREFGDPRTPPIARSEPQEQATAEEMADPARYAEFEARQERKIKRAYVVEAERYVAQLRDDIERGRAGGIPPDEIAKVEEKVRRIEAMRAELLAADPGLLDAPESPPE